MKDRRTRLFLALSGVSLLVLMALPDKQGPEPEPPLPAEILAPVGAQTDVAELLDDQRRRSSELSWGRDPFRYGESQGEDELEPTHDDRTALRLSAISTLGHSPMAIIGHEIVHPTDRLTSGHTVVEIGDREVVLRLDDEVTTLRLGGQR